MALADCKCFHSARTQLVLLSQNNHARNSIHGEVALTLRSRASLRFDLKRVRLAAGGDAHVRARGAAAAATAERYLRRITYSRVLSSAGGHHRRALIIGLPF